MNEKLKRIIYVKNWKKSTKRNVIVFTILLGITAVIYFTYETTILPALGRMAIILK